MGAVTHTLWCATCGLVPVVGPRTGSRLGVEVWEADCACGGVAWRVKLEREKV